MALHPLILGHAFSCSLTQQKLQVPEHQASTVNLISSEPNYDLLLLDLRYGSLRLTNALPVYQSETGLRYLPARETSRHLNFHLLVVPASGQITGFLTVPADRIDIKTKSGSFKRKGESTVFDPALCFEKDGELYIEAELYALITGLKLSWKLSRLELEVRSEVPLSIRREQPSSTTKSNQISKEGMEEIRSPYQAFSFPVLDLQMFSALDSTTKQTENNSAISISGVGDLGYMGARFRLGSNSDGGLASTLALGREDSSSRLLGPFRATKFEFGDLALSPVPLLTRGRTGMGFSISNSPLSGYGGSPNESIEGHAKAGSTVELFRNNVRIGSIIADSTGKYVFENIQMETGQNAFQIVEITPEGEIHEEERTLYGDTSGPKPGENRYQISVSDTGRTLFGSDISGLAGGRNELIGQYQLGLSSGSWMSATVGQLTGDSESDRYFGLGYHSWGGGTQWHLNAMTNDSGGSALSAGLWQKFGSNSISLEHTRLNGEFGGHSLPEIESNATSVTKLRFDGISKWNDHHISYGLSADRYNGTNPSTSIRTRISGGSGNTYFSNTMSFRLSNNQLDGSGLLQFRKRVDRSTLRFDVGYRLGEKPGVQMARLGIDKWLSADYRYRYGLEYDASRSNPIAGIGTIYRAFGPIFLGLNFSANLRGGIATNIMVSAGVTGEPASNVLQFVRPGSGEMGSLGLRVYLDKNLSGTFDAGDVPLPGIGIRVGRSTLAARTDSSGSCTLEHLMPNQELIISLNEVTFEDPCWMANTKGIVAVLRPGSLLRADLAIIETADVEGRIIGASKNTGLVVELIDSKGAMQQTSYVDDQFAYVFNHVRPGDYTLRLKDPDGQNLGERKVTAISAAILKGHDFVISRSI